MIDLESNDMLTIERGAEKLLSEYSALLESIAPYVKDEQTVVGEDAQMLSDDEFRKLMSEIRSSIDDFEGDKAIEVADSILATKLTDSVAEKMRSIREMIDDYDYDGAGELIAELLDSV